MPHPKDKRALTCRGSATCANGGRSTMLGDTSFWFRQRRAAGRRNLHGTFTIIVSLELDCAQAPKNSFLSLFLFFQSSSSWRRRDTRRLPSALTKPKWLAYRGIINRTVFIRAPTFEDCTNRSHRCPPQIDLSRHTRLSNVMTKSLQELKFDTNVRLNELMIFTGYLSFIPNQMRMK